VSRASVKRVEVEYRFRELIASAPPVDDDFADDVRAIRKEIAAKDSNWP